MRVLIVFYTQKIQGNHIVECAGNIMGTFGTYPPTYEEVHEAELKLKEIIKVDNVVITNWLPLNESN